MGIFSPAFLIATQIVTYFLPLKLIIKPQTNLIDNGYLYLLHLSDIRPFLPSPTFVPVVQAFSYS